ncbi:MAG TPA: beta-ketoacyl synthase N-terminal-like domain-containing protein, partial [Polyangiaceae bacterium]|nr:beta-ketoacyl synthase N-terminal-like domain-containing protein [Polyangiaceae bacterium]
DRFTHMALAAAGMALSDAALSLETEDRYRVGVWFGNNAGGWDICERGFHELYRDGATLVNPWQATAWFPTAPQGYVTIRHGIQGMSKSFVCDRASGASALYFAERAIRLGTLDVVLAGGSEAPLTGFGMSCYAGLGELTQRQEPSGAYQPFGVERSGFVLGEGSTVLVLEEGERAKQRGARIYGWLEQGAMGIDPGCDAVDAWTGAFEGCLQRASWQAADVDVVFGEGAASVAGDRQEAQVLTQVFGARGVPVTIPKTMYGHLYGASAVTELAIALLSFESGCLPPTTGTQALDPQCPVDLVLEPRSRPVRRALISSRAREGTAVVLGVALEESV